MLRFALCLAALLLTASPPLACRKAPNKPAAAAGSPGTSPQAGEDPVAPAGRGQDPAADDAPSALPSARKDGDLYWEVIAPHFDRVSVYDGAQVFQREWSKTPEPARHLLTAHWVVMEISNGGFLQLFSTAAGLLVPEAILGLRALGLEENARMLEQAAAVLGKTYPRERKQRERRLEAYRRRSGQENPFAELDAQFFEVLRKQPGGFDGVAARYAQAGNPPGSH